MSWGALAAVVVMAIGCGPRTIPAGTPDQTVADAMRLVCDAPVRAERDDSAGTRSDKVAAHLSDGIGNLDVLTTVEGWKTDGINPAELEALLKRAKLSSCKLRDEVT